jgi:predicted transposase YdaD
MAGTLSLFLFVFIVIEAQLFATIRVEIFTVTIMAKPADIGSKRLISLDPDGWAQWVTNLNDVTVIDSIDAQFQWVSRDSDVLIKAVSPQNGEFLILNEWQLHYDTDIHYRIRAYAGLAEEKYRMPVYPVLVNILRPSPKTVIGNSFRSNFMGLRARQDYKVINLWEVDVEVAFDESLAALLPLAPVMKGGNNENVLRRAAVALEAEDRFEDLQQLLGIFATFVFGVDLVERVMSLQAEAFRASPWAALFEREAEKREALRMLTRLVRRRFGEALESLQETLRSLSVEQLEDLVDVCLDANSLDEFIAAIPQETDNN